MTLQNLLDKARHHLHPVSRWLVLRGVTANQISWTGVGLALASGILTWQGWLFTAGVVAGLSGLADVLDGLVARESGTISPSGIVLDSSLDRYSDFFLLAGFVGLYHRNKFFPNFCLALLSIVGSFMVSYAQAKGEAVNVVTPAGSMKRPMRWIILVSALLVSGLFRNQIPIFLGLLSIGVGANVSAIKRLRLISQAASSTQPTV